MVEEEKKPEEIKAEEPKQEEEEKKKEEEVEEIKPVENPQEAKDGQEESNGDQAVVAVAVADPPPPPEILLKVLMHCEACARKVHRSLKEFPGVEDVITDYKSDHVIVKGEKADPVKVLERVQSKSKSLVELLSPIPNPPEENKISDEEVNPNPPEKAGIVTVVLKVYMHCEKCAEGMQKRIQKMDGVEAVEADLKNSEVTVKGVYDPEKLVNYVYKKCKKHAVIVKQESEAEAVKEAVVEEAKEEEKKGEEGGEKANEAVEEKNEKKEVEVEAEAEAAKEKEEGVVMVIEETKVVEEAEEEVKIIDYFHNNNDNDRERNGVEVQPPYPDYYKIYPPQIFSDENPNACTIM